MRLKTSELVEISVSVSLSFILSLYYIYRMPQGGSISLEMVPIFYLVFRRGWKLGVWAGVVLGILKLFVEPYIVHPVQVVMDYPLPFAVLAIAGHFRTMPLVGVVMACTARYFVHVLAGVVFWSEYAPASANVWVYSLGYNASYQIPETIISVVVIAILWRQGVIKTSDRKREKAV